ncbi:MAG: helix-turn-helix domain-containing protein [Oscillospiraceae bacterium]|jgi:transcriptional regulator with XRE-family HTH domain|nr:helix-turn-helix domain-containing protein [Oscillospiraceae bacterium]
MYPGQIIRKRRKELEMSAETLATLVGISSKTIYKWENGSIFNMGTKTLSKICHVLKTTPEHILGWDTPEGSTRHYRENTPLSVEEAEKMEEESPRNFNTWLEKYRPDTLSNYDIVNMLCQNCPAHNKTCKDVGKICKKNFIKWVNSLVSSNKKD